MSRSNARRTDYRNHLSVGVLTAVTLLCVALVVTFIGMVTSRNRLMALGTEQRQVEHQIQLFKQEIEQLDTRINKRLTRNVVQPRLAEAGTLLREVEKGSLTYLSSSDHVSESPAGTPPAANPSTP